MSCNSILFVFMYNRLLFISHLPHCVQNPIADFRVRRINDLAENVIVPGMTECRGHHKTSNGNIVSFRHHNITFSRFCVHVGVVDYGVGFTLEKYKHLVF